MFRSRRGGDRADWAIKPEQYVDQDSIITAWDDVLRLVATIKLKESTASDIFRRLNSYSRQHNLYTALKAFGSSNRCSSCVTSMTSNCAWPSRTCSTGSNSVIGSPARSPSATHVNSA